MEKREVVLVIDMLNDFCAEGGALFSPRQARIIPALEQFLQKKTKQGATLIFTCDWHEPQFDQDPESHWIPVPHAARGSWGAQIVQQLERFMAAPGAIQIKKTTPDAFLKTDLERLLQQIAPDSLTIVGVCTDICVEATARTARYLGYQVEIPENLVATYDLLGPPPHPGDELHQETLRHLKDTFGVKVTTA